MQRVLLLVLAGLVLLCSEATAQPAAAWKLATKRPVDTANDGSHLASCTEAMTAPEEAPQQGGPSLCKKP